MDKNIENMMNFVNNDIIEKFKIINNGITVNTNEINIKKNVY